MRKIVFATLLLALMVGFYACSKNSEQATLQVRLTDNPTGLREVNVDIQQVRIKFSDDSLSNGGWVDMATNAGIYNLLGLQNGVDTLLATGSFPTDVVKEIRLVLGPNNTVKDSLNVVSPLVIPSGGESGLKIKVNKKLNANLQTLLIDFDAALSIKKEAGGYKLRPVLKIK
jgi:Domain of unknown function (DUF4382)